MKPAQIFCALLLAHASAYAAGASLCGELKNAFGPFDYRRATTQYTAEIKLVEHGHFGADVQAGLDNSAGKFGANLDYALRAFPNHARVLTTLSQFALKQKRVVLAGAKYPVECYFDRAIRFAPDDGTVRAIYGSYLYARGQVDMATRMYEKAYELLPLNAGINYNLALAYVSQNDYAKGNYHAQRAYALGFPLPGLKNKLVAAGKWDDSIETGIVPEPQEPPATAAEAAPEAAEAAPPAAPAPAAEPAAEPATAPVSK